MADNYCTKENAAFFEIFLNLFSNCVLSRFGRQHVRHSGESTELRSSRSSQRARGRVGRLPAWRLLEHSQSHSHFFWRRSQKRFPEENTRCSVSADFCRHSLASGGDDDMCDAAVPVDIRLRRAPTERERRRVRRWVLRRLLDMCFRLGTVVA